LEIIRTRSLSLKKSLKIEEFSAFQPDKKVGLKYLPKIVFNDMSGQKQSKNYSIPE